MCCVKTRTGGLRIYQRSPPPTIRKPTSCFNGAPAHKRFRLDFRILSTRPSDSRDVTIITIICEDLPGWNATFLPFFPPSISLSASLKMSKYPTELMNNKSYLRRAHFQNQTVVSCRCRGRGRPSPLPGHDVHVDVVRVGRRLHTGVLFLLHEYVPTPEVL